MQTFLCSQCSSAFEVAPEDLAFLDAISPVFDGKKYALPTPRFCPACRQQRRMAYRNEQTLYKRACDLCHKDMISVYPAGSPFRIHCRDCWWSDQNDALAVGQDFDFNRPFYEQFGELIRKVPRLGIINAQDDNSDYTNYGYRNKDCYLLFTSDMNQNCYFGCFVWNSRDCVDNLFLLDSELCYECVDCVKCYACSFCQQCEGGFDCFGCFDMKACRNCFGSSGLRNKEYVFFNEQCSKEGYDAKVQAALKDWPALMERLKTVGTNTPRRNLFMVQCENSLGDHLKNCKNAQFCFDCRDVTDCKFVTNTPITVDHCYDMDGGGFISWSYETLSVGATANHCLGVDHNWNNGSNLYHSSYCMSSSDLLGCVGLRNKKYCILNKQYTQDAYEKLATRIVEHMQKTGEWGLFFPPSLSPYGYNETVAQVYYPLSREKALDKGFHWSDELDSDYRTKPFQLIKQEEEFYKNRGLPVPIQHPFVRMHERFKKRNPRTLWNRTCSRCAQAMFSTYAQDRPEQVYCEACYLKTLYT